MFEDLKQQVVEINKDIAKHQLAKFTWGTGSAITPQRDKVIIKASGIPYEDLIVDDMVVVDMSGKVIEGNKRPSVDTAIHLEIYKKFTQIFSIVHTHSLYASAFAQAMTSIPALGTTGADYFIGDIPVTREFTPEEVATNYEVNTGKIIVETFQKGNYLNCPAVLVAHHGPFVWGKTPQEAIYHAVVVEELAKMAFYTTRVNPKAHIPGYLENEHFQRKHGPNARYGQTTK